MGKENKSYRIRTNVDHDSSVSFSVDNSVETLEILSLKIGQSNTYRLMGSNTGIIAGRVLANGGFGVPNVKVSVFIEYESSENMEQEILYHFASTRDLDYDGIRYNLLPVELDDECHQNIGTFPSKRILLDNNNWIEVFDKYYTFTTRTNESGDYLIYGVHTGNQTVHMDVDLSDIGILSQRPRDLIYKGYNANMFESPNKFKVDTNIDSLAQVITQDQTVYVYPFWGDTTDSNLNATVTRCDMNINYKFEPTCIFMGSIISDAGENSMTQKCIGAKKQGKMSEMITGEGKIEMIRKTPNGQIEQFSINGDNNINNDGVWCYQIPMNLDYITTDEYGKTVITDNPNIGIATRARVRFRLSMSESPSDTTARKRARFLIPNNPHLNEDYPNFSDSKEIDYEFGTKTRNENFRDLFWNNVYTVKSYIPRLQKSRLPNNLRHLGIKTVNHSGSNNPMPYNNLRIKFNFIYMFLCVLVKVLVTFVGFINSILTFIGNIFFEIGKVFFNLAKEFNFKIFGEYWFDGVCKLFCRYRGHGVRDADGISANEYLYEVYKDKEEGTSNTGGVGAWFMNIFLAIGCGIWLKGLCETDDGVEINVSPGTYDRVKKILKDAGIETCNDRVDQLYNCIENQLAQDNEVTQFNFYNDWVNGVVYLPLWYRKIKKRRNGSISKDIWCSTDNTIIRERKYKKNLRMYATGVQKRKVSAPDNKNMGKITPLVNNEETAWAYADDESGAEIITFSKLNDDNCYGYQCHKYARTYFSVYKGIIYEKETSLGDKVYYYKPCDYDTATGNNDLVTLFATDLVLLGSLNDCDIHGIPQFFKCLESTTYNMPPDLLSETYDYINENNQTGIDEDDSNEIDLGSRKTEYTGADWGNLGVDQSNYNETVLSILGNDYIVAANENEYDNGGLFYGITCFTSYSKPKSDINLSRICELGVSLDESDEIPSVDSNSTDSGTDVLTPDGFISYDEIYNPDYRSMFATLNANFLRTKLNPETGLLEYDFNHMYLDNFDGSLRELMQAKTVNGNTEQSDFQEKANYIRNYNLEQSSDAYLNFRYGDYVKANGKKIYFYENNNTTGYAAIGTRINGKDRLPRYENSFYFYFGLNEGKTAIDKFNTDFFSDCTNKFAADIPYDMTYQGNSWCPMDVDDGFIAFDMNIDAPYTIKFTSIENNDVYYRTSINKEKFIFYGSEEMPDGYEKFTRYDLLYKKHDETDDSNTKTVDIMATGKYRIEVTDAYDNTYEDSLVFELPRIGFLCDVNPFNLRNADLLERFHGSTTAETYYNIANEGYFDGQEEDLEYSLYNVGDKIGVGEVYYEYVDSHYRQTRNDGPDAIDADGTQYYKHPARIKRDINGYIGISAVTEEDFRIKLEPIDENFFGDNYHGASIKVNNGNVVSNIEGCGYLGHITDINDITTFYFGVPYANQRYRFTVTMLCCFDYARYADDTLIPNGQEYYTYDSDTDAYQGHTGEHRDFRVDSEHPAFYRTNYVTGRDTECEDTINKTIINVIVYEDIFKMYINGIDSELIANFKSGWNDAKLTDGKFKNIDNEYTTFFNDPYHNNPTIPIFGWNDLFNIGWYYDRNNNRVPLTTISYVEGNWNTWFEEMCEAISTSYTHNGEESSTENYTPYTWTDEYCYNAPMLGEATDKYFTGEVQQIVYSYSLAYVEYNTDDTIHAGDTYYIIVGNDSYVLYEVDSRIYEGDVYYIYNSSTLQYDEYTADSDIPVQEGDSYYYKVTTYDYASEVATSDIPVQDGDEYFYKKPLYDDNGNIVSENNISRGVIYYTDQAHTIQAVLGADYIESVVYNTLITQRGDVEINYREYSDDEYLYDGDTYYTLSGSTYIEYTVVGYQNGISVEDFKQNMGLNHIYYLLGTPEYEADYTVVLPNTPHNYILPVVHEDNYGELTYLNHVEYIQYQVGDNINIGDIYYTQSSIFTLYFYVEHKADNQIRVRSGDNYYYGQVNPNIEYSDLDSLTFLNFRNIIDNINEVINKRSDLAWTVAGTFRINDDETTMSLTVRTKANPVRFLICGTGEATTVASLYDYRPDKTILNARQYHTFAEIETTSYKELQSFSYITDGYVVDQYFETPTITFKLPTLTCTNKWFTQVDSGHEFVKNDVYYLCEDGNYVRHISTKTQTAGEIVTDTGSNVYLLEKSQNEDPVYRPYSVSNGQKHPYYVSAINSAESIIPPSQNLVNFDDNGSNKDLTKTLPVHFYNKPLKGKFPIILSFLNNIPAYPLFNLGEKAIYGNRYVIRRAIQKTEGDFEYTNGNTIIRRGRLVYCKNNTNNPSKYYPYTVQPGVTHLGQTVNEIKGIVYTNVYNQSMFVTYSMNDKIFNGQEVYKQKLNISSVEDSAIIKVKLYDENIGVEGITVRDYLLSISDLVGTITHKLYYMSHDNMIDSNIELIGEWSNEYTVKHKEYFEYEDGAPLFIGDKIYDYESDDTYTEYRVYENCTTSNVKARGVQIQIPQPEWNPTHVVFGYGTFYTNQTVKPVGVYTEGTNPGSYNPAIYENFRRNWVVREDSRYGLVYNNILVTTSGIGSAHIELHTFTEMSTSPAAVKLSTNDTLLTSHGTFPRYTHVILYNTNNSGRYSLDLSHDWIGNTYEQVYSYYSTLVPPITVIYGIYNTGKSGTGIRKSILYYYGEPFKTDEINSTWRPVDVFMPGFMSGYLFNGNPIDSDATNIVAELNGKQIKWDKSLTIMQEELDKVGNNFVDNDDVYKNINVKRLIYTDYDNGEHPKYSTYKFDNTNTRNYQYIEVPLSDTDIIYTDGYGEEYRFTVLGTLTTLNDNPVLKYTENGRPMVDIKQGDTVIEEGSRTSWEDFMINRTFYTNDDGYVRHQSLYYIFDTEITPYPLTYYYVDEDSPYNSNLKYDKNTREFYFSEMPDIFIDIEHSKYISKSKSTDFNLVKYLRKKYGQQKDDTGDKIPWQVKYPLDKFFAIGVCDGHFSISPVMETQGIRLICNYTDFDNRTGSPIYITALQTHKTKWVNGYETLEMEDIHYVEDLYYINNYRFTVRVSQMNFDTGKYEGDLYTQICSIREDTAEKCYIKVTDFDETPYQTYWATAIKFDLSSLGTDAIDDEGKLLTWQHRLIEDHSGCIRLTFEQTGNVNIQEFDTFEDMMDDYHNGSELTVPSDEIWYRTTDNTPTAPNERVYITSNQYDIINQRIDTQSFTDSVEVPVTWGGIEIESNTYERGIGKMKFTGDVTNIPFGAFLKNEKLVDVMLPSSNTFKSVDNEAFRGCDNLKFVNIGGAKYIGTPNEDFYDINIVREESRYKNDAGTYPGGITWDTSWPVKYRIEVGGSTYTRFGSNVFRDCSSLQNVDMDNVWVIGAHSFENCTSLEEINLPETLWCICDTYYNIIEGGVFYRTALRYDTQDNPLIIPKSLTGDHEYYSGESITGVSGLKSHFGRQAFLNTPNLKYVKFKSKYPSEYSNTLTPQEYITYGTYGTRFLGNYGAYHEAGGIMVPRETDSYDVSTQTRYLGVYDQYYIETFYNYYPFRGYSNDNWIEY